MSVRIYNISGVGLVIGEKLSQDNEYVYLNYPGVIVAQMTQQGKQLAIVEIVPEICRGRDEIMKRFPLKKNLIFYSGKPVAEAIKVYEQYTAQLQTRLTGIQVVGAGAIPKEPINNKHRQSMRLV